MPSGGITMTDRQENIPPQKVADNAAKGLKFREEYGHGGTNIGLTRARQLKARKHVSDDIIARMVSYFARHEVDKSATNFGNDDNPSKGYIAWLLWGGDEGRKWAQDIHETIKDKNS